MNLLLINYEFPPVGGGAATATYHIGKELAAMGHDVNVLTARYKKLPKSEIKDGVKIIRCPSFRKKKSESTLFEMLTFLISAFFLLPFILKKGKIEGIIVFFGFPCGPLGLWAHLLFKIPYIISLRGGDVPGTDKTLDRLHRILGPLRRLIYKKSKAVVANSEGLKQISQKTDPIQTFVIPNGIDTSLFKPLQTQRKNNDFSFIFVGRLSEHKNLHFLFEQFSVLATETRQHFTINIVGDGPSRNDLQRMAKRLGISDRITWHGWLDRKEVVTLLQQSDCFINPSLCEGMPNAVLEALACGLQVVVSNVAGNNAVVTENENGFLFNIGDRQGLLNLLKKMISNPERQLQTGKNAEKMTINALSWHKTASAYSDIFSHAQSENRGAV